MEIYEIVIIIVTIIAPVVVALKFTLDYKQKMWKQQNKPIPKEEVMTNQLDQLLGSIDQIVADRLAIMRQAEINGEHQTVQSMQGQLKMLQWIQNNKELINFAKPVIEPLIKTITRFKF